MTRTSKAVLTLTAAFLYLPILVLSLFSFNQTSLMAFPIQGFTLHWYAVLFDDHAFIAGFLTSLLVAQPVGLLSAGLGLLAALALTAPGFRFRAIFAVLVTIPFLVPKTVLAIAQAMVLTELGANRGLVPLIASQALVSLPFTTAMTFAVLTRFDPRLIDAARDLGATPLQCFRLVLFPQLKGVLAGAYSVGVILSLADLTISTFLAGRYQPLSVIVASAFRREVRPDLNAMQVIVLLVTVVLIAISQISRRQTHRS